MQKKYPQKIPCRDLAGLFPDKLLDILAVLHRQMKGKVYLVGGTVRDLVLGRKPADIDLTVVKGAKLWAHRLRELTHGTYVELGRQEDAARVVWQGLGVDFSSFREGADSIEEELRKRDITVNSMAVAVEELFHDPACERQQVVPVIDPLNGCLDLEKQCIRVTAKNSFQGDPLRMLRVFRFAAVLGFSIDPHTLELIRRQREKIERVSRERVNYELELIMASERAYPAFAEMRDCGLLWEVLPELRAGVGMDQPASHHLDVFEHCLETLRQMELLLADVGHFFPDSREQMKSWLQTGRHRVQIKWAALFHDIGKPATFGINEDKGGRITFYNHDLQGAEIFSELSQRLRRSKEETALTASLITSHMRPFFLANNQRQGNLTLKACLRLVRTMGNELPGLFLLAMADALAGKGEGSPEAMEQEVADLFLQLLQVEEKHVAPVRSAPPLITGRDLIRELGLQPGPLFRTILERVEEAQMEHAVSTRAQALALAAAEAARLDRKEDKTEKS
jgi:poly(A) polymerase